MSKTHSHSAARALHAAQASMQILANRLWKPVVPDRIDFVYGRIFLHSNQVNDRLRTNTTTDVLTGLKFCQEGDSDREKTAADGNARPGVKFEEKARKVSKFY